MTRMTRIVAVLCVLVLSGSGVRDRSDPVRWVATGDEIAALSPDRPGAYVELGTRMLALGMSERAELVAIEMLARGAVYAERAGDHGTAASACVLLASHVGADDRGALWDLALVLDPSRLAEWSRRIGTIDAERRALDARALACVSGIRYHDTGESRELWDDPGVRARVREAAASSGLDAARAVEIIGDELARALDDPCKGRLYVVDRDAPGRRRVCPDHLRGVGLSSNDERLGVLLAIESTLAGADRRGWGGAGVGGGVRAPAIADLIEITGVDPSRPFYRDGVWTRQR